MLTICLNIGLSIGVNDRILNLTLLQKYKRYIIFGMDRKVSSYIISIKQKIDSYKLYLSLYCYIIQYKWWKWGHSTLIQLHRCSGTITGLHYVGFILISSINRCTLVRLRGFPAYPSLSPNVEVHACLIRTTWRAANETAATQENIFDAPLDNKIQNSHSITTNLIELGWYKF